MLVLVQAMPDERLVKLIFAIVDRDHAPRIDGSAYDESFEAGKVGDLPCDIRRGREGNPL